MCAYNLQLDGLIFLVHFADITLRSDRQVRAISSSKRDMLLVHSILIRLYAFLNYSASNNRSLARRVWSIILDKSNPEISRVVHMLSTSRSITCSCSTITYVVTSITSCTHGITNKFTQRKYNLVFLNYRAHKTVHETNTLQFYGTLILMPVQILSYSLALSNHEYIPQDYGTCTSGATPTWRPI